MDILIVSLFFPPLNSIASLRPYSWAKHWTVEGHSVTVLTTPKQQDPSLALCLPNPGYEVLEVPLPGLFSRLKGQYQASNASSRPAQQKFLVSLFNYLRREKGVFSSCRMPDFSDFWIKPALKKALDQGKRWDLVISSSGPYSVHVIAEALKKEGAAKKWIADYRDPWSHNHIFPGLFPFNFIEKLWEKKLMRSADTIVTVSQPLAETFAEKYGAGRVHAIANGFDPEDLNQLEPQRIFPSDGKWRLVHTGSVYAGKCDPTPLFRAIRAMKEDPLLERLEVIFVGPNQAHLQSLIHEHQVRHWVRDEGFVSRHAALRMQRDADGLLFLPLKEMSFDGILTGKIYEYLFSGTPILAVGLDKIEASQQLILNANCGVALTQVDQIKDFLRHKLKENNKVRTCPDHDLLKNFDRKFLAAKLLNLV